jgi:NADPH:quinone reductase-like Zn-dependent oxidoreductase
LRSIRTDETLSIVAPSFDGQAPYRSTKDEPLCDAPPGPAGSLTVKAVRIERFGAPDVLKLENIPVPAPGRGELLVDVSAAGVGPWDALVRSGRSALVQQLPITLGSDFAGTVVELGSTADEFRVGDAVFGATPGFVGAYAEYLVVPQRMVATKPAGLAETEAASVPIVAVTALQMLNRAGGVSGRSVLVHGAAGAVGSFAVQMAHQNGARVIANAAALDEDYVRELGADIAIDIRAMGFGAIREPVDAVLDTIGGDVQRGSFEVLKRGGSLISVVSPPDEVTAQRYAVNVQFFYVDVNAADLQKIARALDMKALRANVGTVLPLADARLAHEMLSGSRARRRGKIVLSVRDERAS